MTKFEKAVNTVARLLSNSNRSVGLDLILTHECPLRCSYCYVNHDNTSKLTFDQVDYLIHKLCIEPVKKTIKIVEFFGGEPLLEIDLIEKILEKYYNHPKLENTIFGIITSLSTNHSRLLKLLDKYPLFDTVISYDVDNSNRVSKSGKIFNIFDSGKLTYSDLSKYRRSILFMKVITGQEKDLGNDLITLHNIYKNYGILYSYGLNKTPKEVNYDNVRKGISKYLSYLISNCLYNEDGYIPSTLSQNLLNYRKSKLGQNIEAGCSLGRNLIFDGDGNVGPCTITNQNRNLQLIEEGNFNEDMLEVYDKLELNYVKNNICKDCEIKAICMGGCLAYRFIEHKDYNIPNQNHCRLISGIYQGIKDVFEPLSKNEKDQMYMIAAKVLLGKTQFCKDLSHKTSLFTSTIMMRGTEHDSMATRTNL